MPISVKQIHASSKEDLASKLDEILEVQKSESIVGIKGLHLTEEEQLQLVKDLGDRAGWFPNNSENFNHKYVENHSSNSSVANSDGDTVVLHWHLEHVDYDEHIPLVAGVWNMRVFNCDKEAGKTYFIDSRKLYKNIYTDEEKEFLRGCRISWEETYHGDTLHKNYANLVQNHWKTGDEQIRIELHQLSSTELYTIFGDTPTEDQKIRFKELTRRFETEVRENEDLRVVHRWEEGDILIPDLFSMAHAVTGGFDPKDREFTGFWCYLSSPSKAGEDKVHPSWRGFKDE